MATGTGNTLTLVNETYRLMRSGVARRVLYLVDRRALAAQAVQAFSAFEAADMVLRLKPILAAQQPGVRIYVVKQVGGLI
jgi:type I site-specific restriction endonuclease